MNKSIFSLDLAHSVGTAMSPKSPVTVEKHIFSTYADVCAKVKEHEMLHTVHYVIARTGKMEKNFEELLKKDHKVFFEDKDFFSTGVPFIFSGHTSLDCQQGMDRNIRAKAQYRKKKNDEAVTDHCCQNNKVILQDTKKFDCPAMVYIKEIVEFPEFELIRDSSWLRKETSKKLRLAMLEKRNLVMRRKYILVLPDISAHKNHATGDAAGLCQPISEDLIIKIGELVKKGVNTVPEMRRHLDFFVQAQFTLSNVPHKENKRYFPLDKTIRNHK
ncbi:calcium-responsive transcription factor isoform X1 [Hydra vulgaris]|uniref:calcium-responsive transcription factor isoform X1 n=2 Tax=Hydra vulgaris TaxID=6087 RepID=UPI001F5FF499|nr:calcium-responsive transcription factor-like isoform X1 [Hydra vulgaris]